MNEKELLEYCRKNFYYNPETGDLWRIKNNISELITCPNNYGYFRVSINYKRYLVHRIIWLIVYGYMPDFIDHKDINPQNNKLNNLRECSRIENQRNRNKQSNNKSGYKGVCWDNEKEKWMVYINNKTIGRYNSKKEAALVYNQKALELFGEFAKLNIID